MNKSTKYKYSLNVQMLLLMMAIMVTVCQSVVVWDSSVTVTCQSVVVWDTRPVTLQLVWAAVQTCWGHAAVSPYVRRMTWHLCLMTSVSRCLFRCSGSPCHCLSPTLSMSSYWLWDCSTRSALYQRLISSVRILTVTWFFKQNIGQIWDDIIIIIIIIITKFV